VSLHLLSRVFTAPEKGSTFTRKERCESELAGSSALSIRRRRIEFNLVLKAIIVRRFARADGRR
jgi:hypothetical protein